MLFQEKKLPIEAIEDMIQCPVSSVKPYSLMIAPVYVALKLNAKLVPVKMALDFFTEADLQKLSRHDTFYLPNSAMIANRFQKAAQVVRQALRNEDEYYTRTPFELSHLIFTALAPLWGKEMFVDPFFMSIFADELCGPLPDETLLFGREKAVKLHELGLMLSGTYVFIALHLRYQSIEAITARRGTIYSETVRGENWETVYSEADLFLRDLAHLLEQSHVISLEQLKIHPSDWAAKLSARLLRVEQENQHIGYESQQIIRVKGSANDP